MGLVQKDHAQTALPDTSTYAQRQGALQQTAVEVEFLAVSLALEFQLVHERILVHADTHGGQLYAPFQNGIPDEQVAVQSQETVGIGRAPVVIVRGTVVVRFAVGKFASDADDEHGSVLLANQVLALLGGLVGVHLHEFLAMYEVYLLGQVRMQLGVSLADVELGTQYGVVDAAHDVLQEIDVALFGRHGALPVPLVNIEGMEVVQFLVGTYGIHVGDDAIAGFHLVFRQGDALPLGQGVYHLCHGLAHVLYREGNGAFYAVQVVVQAKAAKHKQGCSNSAQAQLGRETAQEEILYLLDGQLCLLQVECRFIVFRYK